MKAYGAKGDGVTNDSAAFASAVAAAVAAGGTVWVPDGTFLVSGITISGACTITGPGTLKRPNATASVQLRVAADNVILEGFTMDGNAANNPSGGGADYDAIKINGTRKYAKILNVTIRDCADNAIGTGGVDGEFADYCLIEGCTIERCDRNAVLLRGNYNRVVGNHIHTTTDQNGIFFVASVGAAATANNVYGNVAANNVVIDAGDFGIEAGVHAHATVIQGNRVIRTNTNSNPFVGIGVRDAQYCTVQGNIIELGSDAEGAGIHFLVLHESEASWNWHGVAQGNTLNVGTRKGINAQGRYLSVIGNQIDGVGTSAQSYGIYSARSYQTVVGNVITNFRFGIGLNNEAGTGSGVSHSTIAGNTINTVRRGICSSSQTLTNVNIANNVVHAATETAYIFPSCTVDGGSFVNNQSYGSAADYADTGLFTASRVGQVGLYERSSKQLQAAGSTASDGAAAFGYGSTTGGLFSVRQDSGDATATGALDAVNGLRLGVNSADGLSWNLKATAANLAQVAAGDTLGVDTIAETTAGNGVRVDTLLLKDRIVGAAGENLGFYGVGPVARPAAYTQTYATATRTHANPTAVALTNSTGVTPDTTVENVPAATQAGVDTSAASLASTNTALTAIENSLSDLADAVNKLVADLANVKQVVNSMLDDDQALGLKQ